MTVANPDIVVNSHRCVESSLGSEVGRVYASLFPIHDLSKAEFKSQIVSREKGCFLFMIQPLHQELTQPWLFVDTRLGLSTVSHGYGRVARDCTPF